MTTSLHTSMSLDPLRLQNALDEVHHAGMPGIAAEVADDGEIWRGSAGFAEVTTEVPMSPDLHHRVGSIAKTFTTLALLRSAETGLVDLDQSIGHYLPELVPGQRGHAVTVRMLANHTSGLAEYLPSIYDSLRAFPDLARTSPRSLEENRFTRFTRRELIAAGVEAPMLGTPGQPPGMYSNTNYLLLAELIELVTGSAAEDHITTEVIVPAGLNDTYFPTDTALARPHSRLYESWFSMADPPRDFSEFDMSWVGPAASLVSTAADLNRFFGLLIGGELLQAESLAQMQRTAPVRSFEGTMIDYGLGLHRRNEAGGTFWGHDGSVWGGGAITMTRADGRRQMTILVNRQRWNELDDSGRPVPHAIDGALEHLYSLALG
ncbi:serine hydrolase domain-containing protein [Brevibacterium sp. S111]|uniref:serine hydrolase domain-containing protein n=2 Tax=Brevibacterium TaxID=1696 RepID=UPI001082126B|nr:serine hydrolase domain-containing protein [Brevibacterium sp. S111]TGD13107.1 class A beta-lactamase-related serine hydrolase [Brevibacterium sp. S111]